MVREAKKVTDWYGATTINLIVENTSKYENEVLDEIKDIINPLMLKETFIEKTNTQYLLCNLIFYTDRMFPKHFCSFRRHTKGAKYPMLIMDVYYKNVIMQDFTKKQLKEFILSRLIPALIEVCKKYKMDATPFENLKKKYHVLTDEELQANIEEPTKIDNKARTPSTEVLIQRINDEYDAKLKRSQKKWKKF